MIDDYLETIIQELTTSPVIVSFKTIKEELTEEDGFFRIKCRLSNGDALEFAEYIEVHKDKIRIESYSYHWQSSKGQLVSRWDNVGHHQELTNFPFHQHLPAGKVVSAVKMNLKRVLSKIEKALPIMPE